MSKMRILIIADEVWNDEIHGNNVLSNWFTGFDAEFAEIYCSPGAPSNLVCTRYFQVTDAMMAKSLLGKRAGHAFETEIREMQASHGATAAEPIPEKFYQTMKSIAGESLRTVRDIIWLTGRYDREALKKFIDDFQPDVVFCTRLLSPKLMRLEKIISRMTTAPFVAFTADDEASMMQVSYSPLFWTKRLWFRRYFKKHIELYRHYFTFSEEQAQEYADRYGLSTSTLYKSGDFSQPFVDKEVNDPIQLVYAGRLYCNRWKTLAAVAKALKVINADRIRMTLDIYTQEKVTEEHRTEILTSEAVKINGRLSPHELQLIYRNADIALHVESFDKKYRYATRVSFSTKIIDLMASSCAILAICWNKHAGFQYLKDNDAAFCVDNSESIQMKLLQLAEQRALIKEYAHKAWDCGNKNHFNLFIRDKLKSVLNTVVQESREVLKPKFYITTTIPATFVFYKGNLQYLNRFFNVCAISSDEEQLSKLGIEEGIRTRCIPMKRNISPLQDLYSFASFLRLFYREKPELVHGNTPKAALLSMVAGKLTGVKVRLYVCHGLRYEGTKGLMRILLMQMEKLTCSCATQIICVSNGVVQSLIKDQITNSYKSKVIHHGSACGINIEKFNKNTQTRSEIRKMLNIQENEFVFIFVGRLVKDKGVNELIEAFILLNHEIYDVHLILIGAEDGDLNPISDHSRQSIKGCTHIHKLGWQKDVTQFLSAADAFVFPSYREGFGMALAEAGAMELAAIASNISGCNEVIVDGINGELVAPGKSKDLYLKMKNWAEDRIKVKKMGVNARNLVVDRYERKMVWKAYLNEYQQLLNEAKKSNV